MKKIILATRNLDKIREIRAIMSSLPLEIESLEKFSDVPEVIEDGLTLEENALKKARQIFQATRLPALSDDTGLEVFSLGLQPGVMSARYAGSSATYEDNCRKLLRALASVPPSDRRARFRCVSVFTDGTIEKIAEGICHGTIIEEPRGNGGFGYDPIFVPDGYHQTFAELPAEIKNRISHRAKAFRRMTEILKESF